MRVKTRSRKAGEVHLGVLVLVLLVLIGAFLAQVRRAGPSPIQTAPAEFSVPPLSAIQVAGDRRRGDIVFVSVVSGDCERCRAIWIALSDLVMNDQKLGAAIHILPVTFGVSGYPSLARWLCGAIEGRLWHLVQQDPEQRGDPEAVARESGIANVSEYSACLEDRRMESMMASFDSTAAAQFGVTEVNAVPAAFIWKQRQWRPLPVDSAMSLVQQGALP
jgi:hypothetical protein